QHIGRQRRDDPKAQGSRKHIAMRGEFDEVARRGENAIGARSDLRAGVGEDDLAGTALDERGAELALELADLHGERRLRDGAILSRAAEMPVAGERAQVTQLTQGDHADKLVLSRSPDNTIRPDAENRRRSRPIQSLQTNARGTCRWMTKPKPPRASARLCTRTSPIATGGRSSLMSRSCIGIPTCRIRWARTSTTRRSSGHST